MLYKNIDIFSLPFCDMNKLYNPWIWLLKVTNEGHQVAPCQ